jgi:hypothetical protein
MGQIGPGRKQPELTLELKRSCEPIKPETNHTHTGDYHVLGDFSAMRIKFLPNLICTNKRFECDENIIFKTMAKINL